MKKVSLFIALLLVAPFAIFADVAPLDYYGKIGKRIAIMLPARHVLGHPLNDEISCRAWTNLVSFYDFDRSVFLKSDLEMLSKRQTKLDDEILSGDVSFGFDIYKLYCERLRERILFATNLLANSTFEYDKDESYRIKRKTATWPATKEEAEDHWRKRLKYEMLAQMVNKELDAEEKAIKKAKKVTLAEDSSKEDSNKDDSDKNEDEDSSTKCTPAENLIKKYRQYATVLTEPDEEAVMQHYMSAVCRAYDPHTDYFSPTAREDFDMDMNLTLCGVGAVLSMDDGALKIEEVMAGGPMDRDGRIKKGDKIVAVAQGTNAFEDVMWRPMKKSIKKIRGPKGTRVTLEIIPRSDPSGTTHKRYELIRDEIKLEDQAATGRVEKVVCGGFTNKVGYIYLPGFYGSMDKKPGQEGYRSSAEDVAKYLAEFNAQDVEGLVLDLRDNGGGSLLEAVRLSALFAPAGPVVQIRDWKMTHSLPIPPGNPIMFTKPMVILSNRASASASEIVAAHLRDIGRAIVLGDVRSHGKGTVQTVLPLGAEKYGSMKITTARFYRINGNSTQVKGVEADIHLPSLLDSLDIGEDKLDNALPFTRIKPSQYNKCWNLDLYVENLSILSKDRLKNDERYIKHLKNVEGMKEISEREEVPLTHDKFKAMAKSDRDLRELDEIDNDDEDDDGSGKKRVRRPRNKRKDDDVVLDESFNVMSDLIRFTSKSAMSRPETMNDWFNAILEDN